MPENDETQETKEQKNTTDTLLETVDRLEKANQKAQELLNQQQQLLAKSLLGGRSDAGQQPAQPKELTPKEYKDLVMQGKTS